MKSLVALFSAVLLMCVVSFCQAPATPAPTGHGAFPVKVTKALDSSRLKEGDSIEVETAGSFKLVDGTLVPKGSKLTGHVMAAKARSKGDADSELNLAFDKLNVANGKQLSIKGVVQAVFPPDESPEPQMAGAASNAAGGGMAGATVGTVTGGKSSSDMRTASSGAMDPKATGVQGMHDLDLSDGVLTSKGKNVKLGSGVRMTVRVEIFG